MVVCVQAAGAQSNKTAKPNKARTAKYVCFTIPVVMVTRVSPKFSKRHTPSHTQNYITPFDIEDRSVFTFKVFTGTSNKKAGPEGTPRLLAYVIHVNSERFECDFVAGVA